MFCCCYLYVLFYCCFVYLGFPLLLFLALRLGLPRRRQLQLQADVRRREEAVGRAGVHEAAELRPIVL